MPRGRSTSPASSTRKAPARTRKPLPDGAPAPPPARVVIENIQPAVDHGRFPIKRTVGEPVTVTADVFADGHDAVAAFLLCRPISQSTWRELRMDPLGNDAFTAAFTIESLEPWLYTVAGWVDRFQTWRHDMEKRLAAAQDLSVDVLIGAELIERAAAHASGTDADLLRDTAADIRRLRESDLPAAVELALSDPVAELMDRNPDPAGRTASDLELKVDVERERARFSSWYEMFPRSAAAEPGRHGTFRDVELRLPYVAQLGFDVLYLPPIHPIGVTARKGKNNNPVSAPGDVGSPWAIGGREGGHKSIHPQLGTLDDFRRLVHAARDYGIELALDIAFQCTPDHPYVKEHPLWFRRRPDGTVQYAENPPKKYQDIYPFEFENPDWRGLWEELKSVFTFWASQGVRLFRVDNPHTKPYAFWEWCIAEVRKEYPDAIFLSEAFTRPKVMYRLAKLGFSQSYTYFTWRNTKWELAGYLTELTQTQVREFFRPNLWPNTPDILPEHLQFGGRPMFISRVVMAATMSSCFGLYGPAFELCVNQAVAPGKEEYLHSEKYEVKHWDLDATHSIRGVIARLNRARRENPALQFNTGLRFHHVDNDSILAYTKSSPDLSNVILVVVSLDPHNVHSGWLDLPLESLNIDPAQPYQAHDLLSGEHYIWQGPRNFVELRPHDAPAHVFRLSRQVRSERDFEQFM
jgi:starch synthase (maltosyl-transferring)